MKFLKDIGDIEGKKVILRADFDVPIEDGKVSDETRIKAAVPTIEFLRSRGAQVLVISHLGRPQGVDPNLSLKVVIPLLEKLVGKDFTFLDTPDKQVASALSVLENLRFWPGEEANDPQFAQELSSLGDLYVNDAFAVSHRSHASVAALPKLLPAYAGLNLEKEVTELSKVLENPKRPLVAILGGAKIETKMPAIANLAKVADKVLVGGKLMFEIGKDNLTGNIIVAGDNLDGKDIGPTSIKQFSDEIARAAGVVWNGPMGIFEEEKYQTGTKAVAQAVVGSSAYSVIGGGDTISALNKFGLLDKIDYVSTGGGAMLEFLAGTKLPGLEALG